MGEQLAVLLFPMALGSALLYLMLGLLMAGLYLTRHTSSWGRAAGTCGLVTSILGFGWVFVRTSPTFGAFVAFASVVLAIPLSVAGSVVAVALLVGWFRGASHQTWDARRAVVRRAAIIGLLIGVALGTISEIWFLRQLSPSLRQFG